jgi:hypothetical protein
LPKIFESAKLIQPNKPESAPPTAFSSRVQQNMKRVCSQTPVIRELRSVLTTSLYRSHSKLGLKVMAGMIGATAAFLLLTPAPGVWAANIVWVSDSNDPATGFFGPLSDQTDSGFVTLLQNAGHNVIRYNQPNANTTLLTQVEIDALNTNDLIIVSRCVNSGAFQTGQGNQWNNNITKPLLDLSAFHARNSRLGWFAANEGPDNTPTMLTPQNTGNPVTDYLFGGVAMSGTNTAFPYDEVMDRNSTPIPSAPVAGGIVYATGTYVQENSTATPPTITTGNFIVGLPAGTPVRGGVDTLGGYRMFFAAGSRESATAPNTIQLYTSRENLTQTGEDIFLRAVQVALNNGQAPTTNTGSAGVNTQPVSLTVTQGATATFSITVTGAAPRSVQWQRDDGSGSFTNIPGAVSAFAKAAYSVGATNLADSGAHFRVIVSNALNVATSDVAMLTINRDTAPPVPISAASLDGSSITVCFDELIDTASMADPSSYQINGGDAIIVNNLSFPPDGRSVNLVLSGPIGNSATVDFFYLADRYGNTAFTGPTVTAKNFGLTGVDIGTLNPPGTQFVCGSNSLQVSGGGLDLGSTGDTNHFVYKAVTGDFDARVRVASFVGTNDHFETTAKALLMARESTVNNAASVNVWVTPLPPGDDLVSASYRATTGGTTNAFGPSVGPSGIPNAWLRIQRQGNQFTTYRSTNGMDWTTLGTATIPLASTLDVGVGVVSHRNGKTVTATFNDLAFAASVVPISTLLTNATYSAGQFSAQFQTQNGVSYVVQYKDDLNTTMWSTLTTVPGDGTVKSFNDPGPVSPTGNRFYRLVEQ